MMVNAKLRCGTPANAASGKKFQFMLPGEVCNSDKFSQ